MDGPAHTRARVAVVGLGGIGSQITLALADRGADVVGYDRLRPPHEAGSSYGESRVIREAYAEGGRYVPLVRRAWELWERLGRRAEEPLLHAVGGIHIGRPQSAYLTSLRAVAAEHGIELAEIDPAADGVFAPPAGTIALRERRAGWIEIERAIASALALARDAGAELHLQTPVLRVEPGARPAVVTTAGREAYDRIVVCAGAWTPSLLPALAPVLTLERQTLVWFAAPAPAPSTVWLGEHAPDHLVYGFPPDRHGLKVAIHHDGPTVTVDELDPEVSRAEVDAARAAAQAILAAPLGPATRRRACVYTNTSDRHFAIGPLPGEERIVVVSACSGHGFKFAPAIGEATAALTLDEEPPVDVSAFGLGRLAVTSGP